jgi:hypothetical protein
MLTLMLLAIFVAHAPVSTQRQMTLGNQEHQQGNQRRKYRGLRSPCFVRAMT